MANDTASFPLSLEWIQDEVDVTEKSSPYLHICMASACSHKRPVAASP